MEQPVKAFAAAAVKGLPNGTVYEDAAGGREIWRGGSPAWRNQNPGNLRPSVHHRHQIGTAGGFAVFATVADGLAAMTALLQRPMYQQLTLAQAIATYAPPENRNPTAAYLAFVCQTTALTAETPMSEIVGDKLSALTGAMCRFEGTITGTIESVKKPPDGGFGIDTVATSARPGGRS